MPKQLEPQVKEPVPRDVLKQAIITVLKAGVGVDMRTLLAVYPTAGDYMVSFLLFDEAIPACLNKEQRCRLVKEEEMDEYCETPEEAAELFLKLKESEAV